MLYIQNFLRLLCMFLLNSDYMYLLEMMSYLDIFHIFHLLFPLLVDMDNIYVSDEKSNVPAGRIVQATEPLVADLGDVKTVKGFVYEPKFAGEGGVVVTYRVETTVDGNTWDVVADEMMFENIVNNPVSQTIEFKSPVQARMIRVVPVRVETGAGAESVPSATYGVNVFSAIF